MAEELDSGRKRPAGTFSFGVNSFPEELWNEWDKNCKESFGDCRWIKMWNDHLVAKQFASFSDLSERIRYLETRLMVLEGQKKEQQEQREKVKTFAKEF